MTKEIVTWSNISARVAEHAWRVFQASRDVEDVELEQLRRETGRITDPPETFDSVQVEWKDNAFRWVHDPTYPAHAGYIVAARGLAEALGYRGKPVGANGEGWTTAAVEAAP